MAIAQREVDARPETGETILRQIELLYGRGVELLRFACDLRIGAVENSPDREACARVMLWRLTVAELRHSNPEFLTANGFD